MDAAVAERNQRQMRHVRKLLVSRQGVLNFDSIKKLLIFAKKVTLYRSLLLFEYTKFV